MPLLTDEEFAAVLRLPGQFRYAHFIKRIVENGVVWGLRGWEDWLFLEDATGQRFFPVWPHERYAEVYADATGSETFPAAIELEEWLDTILPRLEREGCAVAVLPVSSGTGVPVTAYQHMEDIHAESASSMSS